MELEKLSDEKLAQELEELIGFWDWYLDGEDETNTLPALTEAARRLRTAKAKPGVGIREVYEANKDLDRYGTLSDPAWHGDKPIGRLCFALWQAVKAEVEGAKDDT